MFLFGWPSFQCNCYSAFCCKRGQWNHVRIIYVFVFSLDIISELVLDSLDLSLSIYWLPLLAHHYQFIDCHYLLIPCSRLARLVALIQNSFRLNSLNTGLFWLFGQLLELCSITICRFIGLYSFCWVVFGWPQASLVSQFLSIRPEVNHHLFLISKYWLFLMANI